MKVFLCYHSDLARNSLHKPFVHRVSYFLKRQVSLNVFCYEQAWNARVWQTYVSPHMHDSDVFVVFVGSELGRGQEQELQTFSRFMRKQEGTSKRMIRVLLTGESREVITSSTLFKGLEARIQDLEFRLDSVDQSQPVLELAGGCACQIFALLLGSEKSEPFWQDDLPIGYPFDYEKDIVDVFIQGDRVSDPYNLAKGGLLKWPAMDVPTPLFGNPIPPEEAGTYRSHDDTVIVDPRSCNHSGPGPGRFCFLERGLVFHEAGPRAGLCFPRREQSLRIAILVSGGIAPGINAVIDGIVERHVSYHQKASSGASRCATLAPMPPHTLHILLFRGGFSALRDQSPVKPHELTLCDPTDKARTTAQTDAWLDQINDHSSTGGSVISTSRFDAILENSPDRNRLIDEILSTLTIKHQVDICYVVGGEGSMRAAHALATRARLNREQISVVGIPKTMDNDILWVWQSFGFLSAVEKSREFIHLLETEVRANPRLCVVQLFGSDSGFVVSHAVLASGKSCLAALIPEIKFTMKGLAEYVTGKLSYNFDKHPHGIVVLAETAIPVDADDFMEESFIGLDRAEKDAVRKFIGSALLRSEDIPEQAWDELLDGLAPPDPLNKEKDGRRQWFQDALSQDGKALVEMLRALSAGRVGSPPAGEQSAIQSSRSRLIDELNQVFKREFHGRFRDSDFEFQGSPLSIYGAALTRILAKLDQCQGKTAAEIEKSQLLDDLANLPLLMSLPYECLAIIREIERAKRKKSLANLPWGYLVRQMKKRLVERFNRVLFETCFHSIRRSPTEQTERRVFGQTPDFLRSAGLKMVCRCLEREIRSMAPKDQQKREYWSSYRVFSNEPRQVIRAIEPSCQDVIFAHRLGKLAVDNAMAGYHSFMISQWLTEYVLIPLPLVVLGRKRVPDTGIFWKSVVASTGQPANLWYPAAERCEQGTSE